MNAPQETTPQAARIQAQVQLAQFRQQLQQLDATPHSATALSQQARSSQALLTALPPRYSEVLLSLLDRLESSALFTEESCSFSQSDLLDNLLTWADKAKARLDAE
jgi:hypothetical protein